METIYGLRYRRKAIARTLIGRGVVVTDQIVVQEWQPFFLALAGASAALAGLVFVAMSLHPQPILVNPLTRARAFVAAFGSFGYLLGVALALIMLLPARTAPVGSLLLIGLGVGGSVLVISREVRNRHTGVSLPRVVIGDILLLTPIAAGFVGLLQPESEVPFLAGGYCSWRGAICPLFPIMGARATWRHSPGWQAICVASRRQHASTLHGA
jgi:hypothetical protein